jgi:hypothetical protein
MRTSIISATMIVVGLAALYFEYVWFGYKLWNFGLWLYAIAVGLWETSLWVAVATAHLTKTTLCTAFWLAARAFQIFVAIAGIALTFLGAYGLWTSFFAPMIRALQLGRASPASMK